MLLKSAQALTGTNPRYPWLQYYDA